MDAHSAAVATEFTLELVFAAEHLWIAGVDHVGSKPGQLREGERTEPS